MKFEQRLSQKQTQQLVLTQELQQSLQILQFSGEQLFDYINQQAMENPFIELNDKYFTGLTRTKGAVNSIANRTEIDFGQIATKDQSLFDFLLAQVHLNYRDTPLKKIVISLVSFLDTQGFLRTPLDEIAAELQEPTFVLLDALVLLQQLDPAGIAARNLQECLMLQTERDDYAPNLAYMVLESYFDEFVERKWGVISRKLDTSLEEIQKVFDYVQTLTPTPGSEFFQSEGLYIFPDIRVTLEDEEIIVQATKAVHPPLKFNHDYFNQFSNEEDEGLISFMKEKKHTFDWLKKIVDQRGNTILRVAETIVRHQKDFFVEEKHALKPLKLRDIAEELDLHESTISRTVNGKYIETRFGVYELKYFFSTKLTNSDGEDVASATAKNHLERFIRNEDKKKPLSDQKISDMLLTMGIKLSRRTVAKYREELGILGSSKRKRFD